MDLYYYMIIIFRIKFKKIVTAMANFVNVMVQWRKISIQNHVKLMKMTQTYVVDVDLASKFDKYINTILLALPVVVK